MRTTLCRLPHSPLRHIQQLTLPIKQCYTVLRAASTAPPDARFIRNSQAGGCQRSADKYVAADKYDKHTSAPIEIVYGNVRSDKYIVVNKPANLPVQALAPLDSVQTRLAHQLKLHNRPIYFPHRLDKSTSGLLIVVFDRDLLVRFNDMIAQQLVQKHYRAVVQLPPYVTHKLLNVQHKHSHKSAELQSPFLSGAMLNDDGTLVEHGTLTTRMQRRTLPVYKEIDAAAEYRKWSKEIFAACGCHKAYNSGLSTNKNRLLHPIVPETLLHQSVNPNKLYNGKSDNKPRTATTMFKLLDVSADKHTALYDINLVTGRSHQIRIHLADAGLPIINDAYYNLYYIWQYIQQLYSKVAAAVTAPMSANKHTSTLSQRVPLHQQLAHAFATYARRTGAQRQDRVSSQGVYDEYSHYARATHRSNTSSADSYKKQRTSHWRSQPNRYVSEGTEDNAAAADRHGEQWSRVLSKYGVQSGGSATEQKIKQHTQAVALRGVEEVYRDEQLWQPVEHSNTEQQPAEPAQPQAGAIGWLVKDNDILERSNQSFLQATLGLQAYRLSYPHPTLQYKRVQITLPVPHQWAQLTDIEALTTASQDVEVQVVDDVTCVD